MEKLTDEMLDYFAEKYEAYKELFNETESYVACTFYQFVESQLRYRERRVAHGKN